MAQMSQDTTVIKHTATESVPCSYCGHTFAQHSRRYQGYWRCAHSSRCVCVMFKDGAFPVPVSSWNSSGIKDPK
jgi:ribosomal protein L37AE/L43A